MPRLREMKEAASRLSREAFLARYGTAILLPTRVIGGEIKREYAASRQLTMFDLELGAGGALDRSAVTQRGCFR